MLRWFKKKLAGDTPAEAPVTAVAAPTESESGSFFQRLRERLSKSREALVSRVDSLFLGRKVIDEELLDELEEILITADLGAATVQELLERTRERIKRDQLRDPQALKAVLKQLIQGYLIQAEQGAELVMPASGPFVIMVLGVNGVGKTTTIGKLAYKFRQAGRKVLLVAADTFRAAAIEQLQVWGERIGVEVVAQQQGADPSSVIYDALDYARPRDFEVIIIDTAGRLHTKVNLMEELKKIKRVMAKQLPGSPHETMLVLDATTGQNGISQARQFNEAVEITGLTLTKLDGTAKGGIVVNICREFRIPIRFIGIGEQMEDLRDFDPAQFVEALFGKNNGGEA
jgi:fused signal recognition particle receptor